MYISPSMGGFIPELPLQQWQPSPMAQGGECGSFGERARMLMLNDLLGELFADFTGGCTPSPCTQASEHCGNQPCESAPSTPPPPSANGTVTQPSEHYSIGSDLSGPVKQSTTFTPGADGTVLENTRYTDNSGHWYQDNGVYNPATGVLLNQETNDMGQQAQVTTQVQNGQIVSNVTGNTGVSQCVVGFQDSNSSTETISHTDGTSQTEQVTGSNSGPWNTYQMNTPDTVVQQNFGDGNPTVTTENLTNPAASTVSTWV